MSTILERIFALEEKSISKSDLTGQVQELTKEISSLKSEMISKNDIRIQIQTLERKFTVLYVKSTDKISDLKSKIKEKENISESQQSLFLDNILLNDNSTISERGIEKLIYVISCLFRPI